MSLTELAGQRAQVRVTRALTPGPQEQHTFKSLFTLADVATRRRASRSLRKLTIRTDENHISTVSTGSGPLTNLKRSKSSGDVAVLGERFRNLSTVPEPHSHQKASGATRTEKTSRHNIATPPASLSKIPKAKCQSSFKSANSFPPSIEYNDSSITPATPTDIPAVEALNIVDDAFFLMVTPPQTPEKRKKKNIVLAAHTPSLPKVASPFSPRNNLPWPPRTVQPRGSTRSSPGTGHTSASLHLTKSHWELRYETWIRSLRTYRRPHSARSITRPRTSIVGEETVSRSRFPETPTNPALFPRAGSLTQKALHPKTVGSIEDEDARSELELDWALRAWPINKIQRSLFVHDMDVRTWFPITPPASERDRIYDTESVESEPTRVTSRPDTERERERALRRWEWDWELRWRVIEGMAEDENDRKREECEYDVFLADKDCQENEAYDGCQVEDMSTCSSQDEDCDWSEVAIELDGVPDGVL